MKEITKLWLSYAKNDLIAAEKLLEFDSLENLALFHCQQSIEKIIKAHFVENDINIPRIHNLIKLYNLLPKRLFKDDDFIIDTMEELSSVYIDTRYPGDIGLLPSGPPSKSLAESLFNRTQNLFTILEQKL